MSNILRSLPLPRLLLLCGGGVAIGVAATALALGVSAGPTPPPKPLAQALHDALSATPVRGVSARIQYTNHLLEGVNLTSGEASQIAANPLVAGATGRLWIGSEGHARLELQSERGGMEILYNGHEVSLYEAATNILYRYTPPPPPRSGSDGSNATGSAGGGSGPTGPTSGGWRPTGTGGGSGPTGPTSAGWGPTGTGGDRHRIPTVAEIEAGIARLSKHADVSGATPADVAGRAAYTVRVSPRKHGGEIAGAELSWDAATGVPLRAAIYSTTSGSPAIELTATEISYGPVASSTLDFTPPASAKIETVTSPARHGHEHGYGHGNEHGHGHGAAHHPTGGGDGGRRPRVTTHGQGLGAIVLLESPVEAGTKESIGSDLEGLPKVSIDGTSASDLPTELGTLLSFERAGVRYVLVGSVTPSAIEAFARGL